jgi:hypothetical protein
MKEPTPLYGRPASVGDRLRTSLRPIRNLSPVLPEFEDAEAG